jgi:hypothetical protein
VLTLASPEAGLARLDAYEGCDPARPGAGLYDRRPWPVRLETGETIEAWIYHCPPAAAGAARRRGRAVEDGDWARFHPALGRSG